VDTKYAQYSAVILAAGVGYRMSRLTTLPKCAERFFGNPGNLLLNWEHLINQYVVDNPMAAWYDQSNKWVEIDTPEDYDAAKHKFENMEIG
jgi:choline kinase